MAGPGEAVRDEAAYKALPGADRDYWQKGQNDSLTVGQKTKLEEEATDAASYDKAKKESSGTIPAKGGKTDHGALIRNVKEYLKAKLQPAKDIPGNPSPARPLGKMIDESGTPKEAKPPSDNSPFDPRKPGWVCKNYAEYYAALMRALGYPVREVNVKLTQGGLKWFTESVLKTYQEAAVQVWFDGKWHFVDPYGCKYAPADILGVYSDYNDFHTYAWERQTAPGHDDWLPPGANPAGSGWKKLGDDEVGGDLKSRFGLFDPRRRAALERLAALAPHLDRAPLERAEGERAGIVIGTPAEGVELALVDAHGRITDAERKEIPGAIHVRAGTPVGYVHEWPGGREGWLAEPRFEPKEHDEFVFFGTRGLVAEWEELGRHEVTLMIRGRTRGAVPLGHRVTSGDYTASVSGLPPSVSLRRGAATVPFSLLIEPADPCCLLVFADLVDRGALRPEDFAAYHESQLAAGDRRRRAAAGEGPCTLPDEPY